ncbi:unnamed protein product [Urochloa humidicola]
MKFVAAYLLAYLGAETTAAAGAEEGAAPAIAAGPARPSKEDVRRILGSVGAEVEEDRLDMLFEQLEGKDVAELLAAGREQLAYAPSGATAFAVGAAPVAAAKEEEKEEEKKEEEEDEGELEGGMLDLFGDD